MFGILYLPSALAMRRTSTVCAALSNGVFKRSKVSHSRRFGA